MSGGKHCYNWKPTKQFTTLLETLAPTKVSKESVCGSTLLQSFAWAGNRAGVALLLQYGADPGATTAKNPKLPERWAYENNHVGVLAELAKVKEVEPDIMDSSVGKLVLKDEVKEVEPDIMDSSVGKLVLKDIMDSSVGKLV